MLEAVASQKYVSVYRSFSDRKESSMSANTAFPPSNTFPYFYTETAPPLVLLLPYVSGTPVCGLLWKNMKQNDKGNHFLLELIDPTSERTFTVSIRCVSGCNLDIDWDTTAELATLEDSGHPCNTHHPPCLGKSVRVQETHRSNTSATTLVRFWQKITQGTRPKGNHSSPDVERETLDDTEIPELTLLRSSLQITPDRRAYRVVIEKHCRKDAQGIATVFCITLSFGRCGLGHNILSFRCREGNENGGLTITIQ
jgi:hypothetical protein